MEIIKNEDGEYLSPTEIIDDMKERLISEGNADNLASTDEDDLIMLHHGFGTSIRNRYGLWREDNPYTNPSNVNSALHPDTMSVNVIKHLWEQVRSEGYPKNEQ